MATITCEPPPMTKAALPPDPPCIILTTAPLPEHQGERHPLAAVPVAQEPRPVVEPPAPLGP